MVKSRPKTVPVEQILKDELERIRERRGIKETGGGYVENLIGLALSGGGVRSATFNLGFLQALEQTKNLRKIDYLSTVSGGGYIGSCMTWFMSVLKMSFPFATSPHPGSLSDEIVAWLRAHSSYLAPRKGLTRWTLFSTVLGGAVLNLLVLLPLFFLAVHFLAIPLPLGAPLLPDAFTPLLPEYKANNSFSWMLFAGVLAVFMFVCSTAFVTIVNSAAGLGWRNQKLETKLQIWSAKILMMGVVMLAIAVAIGSTPLVYAFLRNLPGDWIYKAISSISISGIATLAAAIFGLSAGRRIRSVLLYIGLASVGYGLLLLAYDLSSRSTAIPDWLVTLAGISVVMSLLSNVNYSSMHRYYRNRLMEAYMPSLDAFIQDGRLVNRGGPRDSRDREISLERVDLNTMENPSDYRLADIPQTTAPYHIINTNVVTYGSDKYKLRSRKGDSFILTPLYCGSWATGYVPTNEMAGSPMTLATAFSISGAAVDPSYFFTDNRPISFLMSLLNIRLGYWVQNPGKPSRLGRWARPWWHMYMLRELFTGNVNEGQKYVYLSDGGHFENLGVYELVRRKCRLIIAVDAGADPDFMFADLGRLIHLVRTDFNVNLILDYEQLIPAHGYHFAKSPYVIGRIIYRPDEYESYEREGILIFVKPTLIESLSADVKSYAMANPDFPNESTTDQFFDERQFEAYRELGYQIGMRLAHDPGLPRDILPDNDW